MIKPSLLNGVLTGGAVLCIAALAFAQNPPAPKPVEAGVGDISKCPVLAAQAGDQKPPQPAGPTTTGDPKPMAAPYRNSNWWPNQLNLDVLHSNSG